MTAIAYVLKMYPRFSETFIVNEILELERQGVGVRIYSLYRPDDGRFHASLARVKAPVVYVPQYPLIERAKVFPAHRAVFQADRSAYLRVLYFSLRRGHRYAIRRFLQAGVIAEHVMRHPVDALHAHFASSAARAAMLVGQLLDVPYSFTAHAKDIFHQQVDPDSLRSKMRAARFVVTVSDFNRAHLQNLLAARPGRGGDVRRLYNGIDLSIFSPAPSAAREPDLILGVGRLVEKKGFDDLIRACALLSERGMVFRCEIVGSGELRPSLENLAAELKVQDRVKLVGPKPQEEVIGAYRRATIFALPCVIGRDGNRDGLPTVLLEAMASGLPVVSTDVTGVPEIINANETGLIVPPGDPTALADALARLLAEPALRERLSAAARLKVERDFDIHRNVGVLRGWLADGISPIADGRSLMADSRLLTADGGPPIADSRSLITDGKSLTPAPASGVNDLR